MGLDISAYSKLSKIDCVFNADGEPIDPETKEPMDWDDYVQIYVSNEFPGRADELDNMGVYSYADSDGFRAGGYGGFNHWRDQLAEMAGYRKGQYEQYGRQWDSHCVACWRGATGPFSELINFSDCEGTIGASVCRKLAADFADFQKEADQKDEDFKAKYALFRSACNLASDGGCLKFH